MRISGPLDSTRELHVASLLVHCQPVAMTGTAAAVAALPGAEVHGADPAGKLLVTLEGDSEGEILRLLHGIQSIENVLSAILVYHQVDRPDTPPDTPQTERHALP